MSGSGGDGTAQSPSNQLYAGGVGIAAYANPGALTALAPASLAPAGGGLPHNNMQPYLTFYFNIALQGVFPPRT